MSSPCPISIAPPTLKKPRVSRQQQQAVVLFYKYAPLSDDRAIMSILRAAVEDLCKALELTGRVLLGMSKDAEGINGTLAGIKQDVEAFTVALLGKERYSFLPDSDQYPERSSYHGSLERFWQASEEFARAASVPVLRLDSPEDFKWSSAELVDGEDALFPDLNIKLVKEIISTGGKLSSVKLEDTKKGYLTPEEWHEEIQKLSKKDDTTGAGSDTVLIDCRNHKEYEIGHFESAIDPNTKTFEQFPRWVAQNKSALEGKTVLMYCTGGIRCEKASAYIRRETDASNVQHLKGGIHKYLDKFGSSGCFRGKNFVFDRRGAAEATTSAQQEERGTDLSSMPMTTAIDEAPQASEDDNIVGHCLYCEAKYDTFTPDSVCTVCREPTLVCTDCKTTLREYHCGDHSYLRNCYFSDLACYSSIELKEQLLELEAHRERMAVGKRYKQKRKTLKRQCDRVTEALEGILGSGGEVENIGNAEVQTKCRNCGDASCDGKCWGFHGLGRKDKLKTKGDMGNTGERNPPDHQPRSKRASANQRSSKIQQKEQNVAEIIALGLSAPPSAHRCPDTSLRCPPPCTRVLQCYVKGKWCGRPVLDVIKTEFADLANDDHTALLMSRSLIRLNGVPVGLDAPVGLGSDSKYVSASTPLKNMDVISRVVHWHEPPAIVNASIHVTKVQLPANVREAYNLANTDGAEESYTVFCCDKPVTVPVHPAGPYLSNSLTLMVEAQEGLGPRSLRPCHRLDRCTSGLTLCSTSSAVARLLQGRMEGGGVSKLYVARVVGMFPNSRASCDDRIVTSQCSAATWTWNEGGSCVEVDAPIANVDPINGIRAIQEGGKPSRSRYRLISYDETTGASLIACFPVTGRGHQLRVHLQWLGYPIFGDVQYCGKQILDDGQGMKDAAIHILVEASKKGSDRCFDDDETVSEEDIRAAKELCRCCAGGPEGIKESFSPAQLLEGGHSIHLHAWKYRVGFERRAKKKKQKQGKSSEGNNASNSCREQKDELASIEFSTALPSWGTAAGEAEVDWLS